MFGLSDTDTISSDSRLKTTKPLFWFNLKLAAKTVTGIMKPSK